MVCKIVVILVGITQELIFHLHGVEGGGNPDLYSVVEDGEVVYTYTQSTGTTPALGNQVQIRDNKTGYYYRYCHMLYNSITVNVGDKVNLTTKLGKMGNTGNSTGTHLHLELSTTERWICGNFLNPVEPLGIPNIQGTIVKYDGSIVPPEPTPSTSKNSIKWLKLRAKKINIKY